MKRLRATTWILTAGLILFFYGFKYANAQPIEETLQQIMKQYEAVGLQVAVVKNKQIIYAHSFGWKDREQQIPLTNTDIYRIASISKSFSATSIMQLIEAGKVSLDDDVSDLIGFKVRNPRFPETVITLKMLLSHTSSINDKQRYSSLDIINPSKNDTWQESYNDYAPGADYEYCNLNFNMVGAIIERLSGERFDLYVKKHVLDPLGLYAGYCVDSLDATRFAQIYSNSAETGESTLSKAAYAPLGKKLKNYRIGYDAPIFSPTGGMKISATDLAKYMLMHMHYGTSPEGVRIMDAELAKQMQTPHVKYSETSHYGYAIRIPDNLISGKTMIGHTGSAYGLFSSMFFVPEEKIGIVVLSSGSKRAGVDGYNGLLKPVNVALYNHFIQ